MPTAAVGNIELAYDVHGDPQDPALVLMAGLGNPLLFFEDEFVQGLVDRSFRVVRFDNRDSGLSTTLDEAKVDMGDVLDAIGSGRHIDLPYTVSDMAADAVGLLDHLGIDRAHVLGVSLGGMVAQSVAIEHPTRVQSLTLVSSTTGSADVGQPTPEAIVALLSPNQGTSRAEMVEHDVASRRIWATVEYFEEAQTRSYFEALYDRGYSPGGQARQMAAVLAAPDREPSLARLSVPTLILHGTDDKLIAFDGGARLAELIPGAELVELQGMGHDLPAAYWGPVIEAITQLAVRSMTGAR